MSTWEKRRTPEGRAHAAAYQRARRASLAPEQRVAENQKKYQRELRRRARLAPEQRQARARKDIELRRLRKARLTEADLQARRERDTAASRARRAAKSPEERAMELKRKRELERARRAAWTPEQTTSRYLRMCAKQLGLDPDVVEAHFVSHSGLCDICGRTAAEAGGNSKRLSIDHDHSTGEFRGLLCHFCNLAIGQMDDNPDRLMVAAEYLLKHSVSGEVAK